MVVSYGGGAAAGNDSYSKCVRRWALANVKLAGADLSELVTTLVRHARTSLQSLFFPMLYWKISLATIASF